MLIGHNAHIQVFKKMRLAHQIPHSFLLTGPSGVGKKNFALYCAELLLQKPIEHNPNVIYLNRPTIQQVRELNSSVSKTAFASGIRVVVIDNIHAISHQATNALLKTIEEPRTQTIFFLIAPHKQNTLPTIQSRCVHLYFGFVPLQEIQKHLDTSSISELQVIWEGRPAIAQELLHNQDFHAHQKKMFGDSIHFLQANITQRFLIATQYEKESLQDFITMLILIARSQKNYSALNHLYTMQPTNIALHRFIITHQ